MQSNHNLSKRIVDQGVYKFETCSDTRWDGEGRNSQKELYELSLYESGTPDALARGGCQSTARKLLMNRYRVLLTRGIKGTFVFCEDKETAEFMKGISGQVRTAETRYQQR